MTINRNLILLFAICIFVGGGIGSYKSFQLYRNQTIENNISKNQESSQWMAQSLEQKIKQLESSVSYLDQSTIETLKRFGARYFAYAYKDKKNEWSVKWKKIGKMGKEAILSEVDNLGFDELSEKKRNWKILESNKIVFISPVKLAESHQLKKGFLVFGLDKAFFQFLNQGKEQSALVTEGLQKIVGSLSVNGFALAERLQNQKQSFRSHIFDQEQTTEIETAYFSQVAQGWILKKVQTPQLSFIGSSFFTYFILSSLISVLIFILALSSKFVEAKKMGATLRNINLPNFDNWKKRRQTIPEYQEEDPLDEKVHISDFGEFIENIIEEEAPRLNKLGVGIKTQFEEAARVYCAPKHISDLLKRLIGNSVLVLENEEEKEIQIQLVEQKKSYQLIYVDTRRSQFPSHQTSSLLSQTEGSMEGIDGIIAYAQWFYGKRLTVAKKGFCLSVDLLKEEIPSSVAKQGISEPVALVDQSEKVAEKIEVQPLETTLDRIEIHDDDTDNELFSETSLEAQGPSENFESEESGEVFDIKPLDLSNQKKAEEPEVSFDRVIEEFRLKELSFEEDNKMSANEIEENLTKENDDEMMSQDENGLYEIKSGQFKLKIRAPKKKDTDVHS